MALDQQQSPRREWHLDRKVPVTIIFAIIGIIITGASWKVGVENAQANLDRRVTTIENSQPATAADRIKINILEANLEALKEQVAESRKVLDEIRTLLIQERSGGVRKGQ
jgi:uncharacterized membrane protein affecting hemolysin expression